MLYPECFDIFCLRWFGNVSQKDKNKLQRVVNINRNITGFKQSSLTALYEKQVLRKADKINTNNTHILHNEYIILPPYRKVRTIISKTNRKGHSFFPISVRLLNDKHLSMCVCFLLFLLFLYLLTDDHNYNYEYNFKLYNRLVLSFIMINA